MKATGIIRRVDDLGRVVIPKEIRRTLGIREGEPLEIYTDTICGKPAVCFVKFETNLLGSVKGVQELIEEYLDYDHPHRQEVLARLAEVARLIEKGEE